MSRRWLWLLTLAAAVFFLAAPVAAEQPKGGKRAQLVEMMRQRRASILRHDVGLDEKTAQATEKVLDKIQAEREKLEALQREDKKKLKSMLELDVNDQAAYDKCLRSLLDTQLKLATLRQQELDELAKVLTPKQRAKLAVVMDKTLALLRKKVRDRL